MSNWKTDLTPINTFIEKYKYIDKNYQLIKTKKKHIFKIKDGIFNFKINFKSLTCKCLSKKKDCKHLINYLLDQKLYWTNCYLVLYNKNIRECFVNNKDDININSKIYQMVDECMICLDPIKSANLKNSYCCIQCVKLTHYKCIIKWHNSKNKNSNKCPHCMENIIL
tara:strand:+ start:2713 stop:3213 length:501 start_codon:yes stop_codon:yes gene_type:complete